MPVDALSGHGTQISVTLDYAGAPTVFSAIPGLRGEISKKFTLASKDVTAHDDGVSRKVYSNIIMRDPWTFSFNYNPDNATHLAIRDIFFAKETVSVKALAPGGVVNTSDDITMTGKFTSVELKDGEYENERSFTAEFTPTGAFTIDGVTFA